ncbi:hypothetical protein F5Y08DRAFT_345552 [Xylaria arbuscula]|nr:hypothetical protein F5Y08DRAFT_345552 [Xylaria arbuscula]
MSDYFTSVTSTSALHMRTPRPLYNQDKKLPPGSSWSADELTTFRVVVNVTNTRVVPHLKENTKPCDNLLNSTPMLKELLRPTPDLEGWTEIDLVSQYGGPLGQFWAALAELHPDMVDSTQMQVASSSPFQPSSQVSSQDDAFVPEARDLFARDANTERLLTYFLRYLLYSIPYSTSDLGGQLKCRSPVALTVFMTGGWSIRAEDDGGLRWRPILATLEDDARPYYLRSQLADCYRVLFEAKKQFRYINN